MRRLLTVVTAVAVVTAMLCGGCIKITRDQGGRTHVKPGTIEVTRQPQPHPGHSEGPFYYEGTNP